MELNLRSNYRYAIACPTSMGVRITPDNRMAVHNSNHFYMQATSAESNVLNVASSLGNECLVLTKFVKGSPIAQFIKNDLRRRNINYEGVEVDQGGPWGYRHQFNIADSGFGMRAPRVWNDRAGEVGRTLDAKGYDTKKLFGKEGVRWFHTGGIFAALSETTAEVAIEALKAAKKYGTITSYDLNYRASLWKSIGGQAKAQEVNREIAKYVDVMIGNEEDFTAALGIEVEGVDENLTTLPIEGFRRMIETAVKQYPNFKAVATTLRSVKSATINDWSAICWYKGELHRSIERPGLEIYDRVGGGDSFASGLIYGFMTFDDAEKAVNYGAAHGALAMTTPGDTSMATKADVEKLAGGGSARVDR